MAEPRDVCPRCKGEEVIWGGCLQESDGNYFDPCPDCMGFDDEQDEEHNHG
jgi:hypothetical protein